MRLFYGKRLAFCCFMFICGALIGSFADEKLKNAAVAILMLSAVVFIALSVVKKKIIYIKYLIPMVLAIVGVFYFAAFLCNINEEIERYKTSDNSVEIEATVLSEGFYSNYLCIFDIRVHRIGDEKVNKLMRFESDRALDIKTGEQIVAEVYLSVFENSVSFNEKQYYNSKGIYFLAKEADANCLVLGNDNTPELFFRNLNNTLCRRISSCLNKEAAGIVNAIFLGNRKELEDSTKRDFIRTGSYHLLALSGMHLSIISKIFDLILIKLRMGKSRRFILLSFLILFYVALTGFGLSVVRSAIMVFATYVAYFLRVKSDSFTALTFAASAILCVSPSSISDIGFWLSVLSTLGIIIAVPLETYVRFKLRKHLKSRCGRNLKNTITGLIYSFSATLMTLPFSCFSFKAISLVGPIVTLILSPVVSFILIIAPFILLLSGIPIISEIFAFCADTSSKIICGVSEHFSGMDNIYLSLNYEYAKYFTVIFFFIFSILLVVNLKHKIIVPIFTVLSIIVFCVCEYNVLTDETLYIDYRRIKENEYVFMSSSSENVLIDISDGASGRLYDIALEASDRGNCEIETLVLTHLHRRHINALVKLSDNILIRRLMIPIPINDSESYISAELKAKCETKGIEIVTYSSNESCSLISNVTFSSDRAYINRSTHPVFHFELSGGVDFVYIGSSYLEYMDREISEEYIIMGTHGPVCKSKIVIDAGNNAKLLSIADEDILSCTAVYCADSAEIVGNTERISIALQ